MQIDDNPQGILTKSEDQLIVLSFTTPWSGAGSMLASTLARLQEEKPTLQVLICDLDTCPKLVKQFGIAKIPTTILLHKRKVVDLFTGPVSRKKLLLRIVPFLS
jgi:thioredoxin-like negative regulator of GroEL